METSLSYHQQTKHDARLRVDLEIGLLITLIGLIFLIRITNLAYNTLFVDEAVYVTGGRDLLAGLTDRHILDWFGGSYLYPFIAAVAANVAGVLGVRLVSALLTTLTAVLVYMATRRLFGRQAALWATLIFGLSGGSISLGQFAVYDVLMLPFLAGAFYCLISAAQAERRSAWKYLILGALSYSGAALAKYTAIFYLPALFLTAFILYLTEHRWRDIKWLIIFFLIPVAVILGAYTLYFFNDLMQVFSGQQGFQAATRLEVVQNIWDEIGVATVVSLLGMLAAIVFARNSSTPEPAAIPNILRNYPQPKGKARLVLAIGVAIVLFCAYLSLPLYQILTSNIRSVWKATFASLVFLAPFAGYMVAMAVQRFRLQKTTRVVGAALITLLVVTWLGHNLDRNWGFQHSWPNGSGVINYLQGRGLSTANRVLAEGGAIYESYFYPSFGLDGRKVWTDTWYMDYKELHGTDAMTAAIADHYFDFVVLDDNYTPDVNPKLDAALVKTGYTIGYESPQSLTIGHESIVRVYTRP